MKIKAIIFDLGEVLLTGIRDTGLAIQEKHKIILTGPKFDWAHVKTPLLIPLVNDFFLGKIKEDEYIKAVLEEYPQIGSANWLKKHIRENFREVEGSRELVVKLRKLGYKTAILSVHSKEWIKYCENKFDFHKLFDVIAYSYEDKISKPHPNSFLGVLQRLNAKPEECIFIDDNEKNIDAAKVLGIKGILFTTAKDLEGDLKKILPNF